MWRPLARVRVVKHGNRASSSSSGSADVLEALGINLTLPPSDVAAVVDKAGITFCFAQQFHPAMRHAAAARRDLGIGTAFNFLGPLTNPAQPTYAAVGVADARMAPLIAGVFAGRGKDAAVFRGDDGLDELTISTTSRVWWVRNGAVREYNPGPCAGSDWSATPWGRCVGRMRRTTPRSSGTCSPGAVGPVRDAVVLNAGVALALTVPIGQRQVDFVASLQTGMDRAAAAASLTGVPRCCCSAGSLRRTVSIGRRQTVSLRRRQTISGSARHESQTWAVR